LMEKHKSASFRHEAPQRAVYLPDFQISKYPVTNAQYKAFVDATGRGAPWDYPKDKADHPVTRVNLRAAWAFCHWAGCRLPTEVEWEKAARGTDGREYPWGNEWREGCCNSREANVLGTTPVGYYEAGASPYGVYDMAGNAWEWTDGWLISDVVPLVWWAEGSSRWDSAKYGERMDRQYKSALNWPVLRGGGIDSNRLGVRCAFRLIGYEPFIDGDFFGFRCVRY
jgi:formylglycine-generating enzyme required for sulfatase activity